MFFSSFKSLLVLLLSLLSSSVKKESSEIVFGLFKSEGFRSNEVTNSSSVFLLIGLSYIDSLKFFCFVELFFCYLFFV